MIKHKQNRHSQLPWKDKKPNHSPSLHMCVEKSFTGWHRSFFSLCSSVFCCADPGLLLRAGSASSYDGFSLPRPLLGLLMQSARKSPDIKHNGGKRSRKSYRAGMNSFPFEFVPFLFNLLLSASSWPESSLCFSSMPEGSSEFAAHWPWWAKHMFCSCRFSSQSSPTLQQDFV